jgi:class I fructose-bisphosphate aldolase
MDVFLKDGRGLLLAYDQGLEHGPSSDFNERNVDPSYIIEIANKGNFTGVVEELMGNQTPHSSAPA